MKEPVDHILRPPLPWRCEGAITECGYNATKVPTITREAHIARRKDLGQQRTAMLTCMTCSETASRWGTWDDDPRQAMQRELEWEGGYGYSRRNDRGVRLRDELLAILALIENHGEEFQAHLTATAERRAWLARKTANAEIKRKAAHRQL